MVGSGEDLARGAEAGEQARKTGMAPRHLRDFESGKLLGHARSSPAVGQPARWRTLPSCPTRRLGRPSEQSHSCARSPRTIAAVLAELASMQDAAAIVAVRHGPSAGLPVAGSMR